MIATCPAVRPTVLAGAFRVEIVTCPAVRPTVLVPAEAVTYPAVRPTVLVPVEAARFTVVCFQQCPAELVARQDRLEDVTLVMVVHHHLLPFLCLQVHFLLLVLQPSSS